MTIYSGIVALIILIAINSGLLWVFHNDKKNIDKGILGGIHRDPRDRF